MSYIAPTSLRQSQTRAIKHLQGQPGKPFPFRINEDRFVARRVFVAEALVKQLRINPELVRPFLKVLFLDSKSYARFCQVMNYGKPAAGFYPLGKNGDHEALLRGEIPYLPDRSRVIVLPEDFQAVDLAHELLHDIYSGGGLSVEDRVKFTNEILRWYRLSIDPEMPHQHKNRPFYEDVAEMCMGRYSLQHISPWYGLGRHEQERGFQIFAAECLAHTGEAVLFPDKACVNKVPQYIIDYLRHKRLFDRSVFQQLRGQTLRPQVLRAQRTSGYHR